MAAAGKSKRWHDLRDGSISGFGCKATKCLCVCHTKNNTTDRRGDRGARRTCASAGESAPAVGVLLLTKGKDNEGQGQGHGRAADGKRAAVVVVGVVGISQKEKNKRQRENLARYPNLGFTHFVERTEFQGRGSAHGHALWWHPHAPTDAEDEEEDDEAFFDFPEDGGCGKEMGVSPLC